MMNTEEYTTELDSSIKRIYEVVDTVNGLEQTTKNFAEYCNNVIDILKKETDKTGRIIIENLRKDNDILIKTLDYICDVFKAAELAQKNIDCTIQGQKREKRTWNRISKEMLKTRAYLIDQLNRRRITCITKAGIGFDNTLKKMFTDFQLDEEYQETAMNNARETFLFPCDPDTLINKAVEFSQKKIKSKYKIEEINNPRPWLRLLGVKEIIQNEADLTGESEGKKYRYAADVLHDYNLYTYGDKSCLGFDDKYRRIKDPGERMKIYAHDGFKGLSDEKKQEKVMDILTEAGCYLPYEDFKNELPAAMRAAKLIGCRDATREYGDEQQAISFEEFALLSLDEKALKSYVELDKNDKEYAVFTPIQRSFIKDSKTLAYCEMMKEHHFNMVMQEPDIESVKKEVRSLLNTKIDRLENAKKHGLDKNIRSLKYSIAGLRNGLRKASFMMEENASDYEELMCSAEAVLVDPRYASDDDASISCVTADGPNILNSRTSEIEKLYGFYTYISDMAYLEPDKAKELIDGMYEELKRAPEYSGEKSWEEIYVTALCLVVFDSRTEENEKYLPPSLNVSDMYTKEFHNLIKERAKAIIAESPDKLGYIIKRAGSIYCNEALKEPEKSRGSKTEER